MSPIQAPSLIRSIEESPALGADHPLAVGELFGQGPGAWHAEVVELPHHRRVRVACVEGRPVGKRELAKPDRRSLAADRTLGGRHPVEPRMPGVEPLDVVVEPGASRFVEQRPRRPEIAVVLVTEHPRLVGQHHLGPGVADTIGRHPGRRVERERRRTVVVPDPAVVTLVDEHEVGLPRREGVLADPDLPGFRVQLRVVVVERAERRRPG